MSLLKRILLASSVVWLACGRAEPPQRAPSAPMTREVVVARDGIDAPTEDVASAPVADIVEVGLPDAEPPEVVAATEQTSEPSVLTPLPELCRQACANAHRLVLAELPADTAKAMRDEVGRALERECPGRCLQRASVESARCFVSAKSALELAVCPQ